jgi:hypothetical protein
MSAYEDSESDLVFFPAELSVQAKTSTPLPLELPCLATTATFSCSITRMVANADRTFNSRLCSSVGDGGLSSGAFKLGSVRWIREIIVVIVRKAMISESEADFLEVPLALDAMVRPKLKNGEW